MNKNGNSIENSIVDFDSPTERFAQVNDLRYVLVLFAERGQRVANEHVYFALLARRVQVQAAQQVNIVIAAATREREHDDRQQLLRLQHVNQRKPDVLLLYYLCFVFVIDIDLTFIRACLLSKW